MLKRLSPIPLVVVALALASVVGRAQMPYWGQPFTRVKPGVMPAKRMGFTFCRLQYTSIRREDGGSGWNTDYPGADQNFMIRLSELTDTDITKFDDGDPAHALIRATDPVLFQCPFLYASDIGTVGFSDEEVASLREYLLKGGLFWVDDFWGTPAWEQWTREIKRVLPEYSIVEIPPDHPILSDFYQVDEIPQVPSIQHWRRTGGSTSERGADSKVPRMYGIFDEDGRLLVAMTHDTDIADGWERESEDWEFFHAFSPYSYAVGINVAIWSMTH